MKSAYFDCYSGISGDMAVAALLHLGLPEVILHEGLAALGIDDLRVEVRHVKRNGISAAKIEVVPPARSRPRHYSDIRHLIENSSLPDGAKTLSLTIFHTLAEAEAAVHSVPIDKVHFHEVGGYDSIADIVGTALLVAAAGWEQVTASPLHVGSGYVTCEHGTFPIPAPATAEILKGVPLYSRGVQAELTTPTGAAIIKTLATSFGPLPALTVEKIGYGAGSYENPEIPNALRILSGTAEGAAAWETMVVLETHLDQTSPEILGYALERLLKAGALDAAYVPLVMKKSRPGVSLVVMARREDVEPLMAIISAETGTLGIRVTETRRKVFERRFREAQTPFGPIRLKEALDGPTLLHTAPEFEDCKSAAIKYGVPLREVMEAAVKATGNRRNSKGNC